MIIIYRCIQYGNIHRDRGYPWRIHGETMNPLNRFRAGIGPKKGADLLCA